MGDTNTRQPVTVDDHQNLRSGLIHSERESEREKKKKRERTWGRIVGQCYMSKEDKESCVHFAIF